VTVHVGRARETFPQLKTTRRGVAAEGWEIPAHAPSGAWTVAAGCRSGDRAGSGSHQVKLRHAGRSGDALSVPGSLEVLSAAPMINFPSSGTGGYPFYPEATAADCPRGDGRYSWCIGGDENSPYGYGYRNCTDYVAWVLASLGVHPAQYQGLGYARTWGTRAASHGVVNNGIPGIGSVAVNTTAAGGLGHVAFVTGINGAQITVSEYNEHGDGTYSTQTGTAASLGFTSFDHFEQYETSIGTGPGPGGSPGGYDNPGKSTVSSVSKDPDDIDTFYVTTAGCLDDAWWNPSSNGISQVACNAAAVAPAPVSKDPDDIDTFYVTTAGCLDDAWWNPSSNGISQVACNATGWVR
jgi:surface antigen